MKKLGFIINPIAGMGGSVGLAGTDNVVDEALRRGAVPRSNQRAKQALEQLLPLKEELEIHTCAGPMGGALAKQMGFHCVCYEGSLATSQASDTIELARRLKNADVDLLLFAGGDGTARDIYQAVGTDLPALGIPAGVKIHSPVYGKNPSSAGELAALYLSGKVTKLRDEEVLDIDEDLYRQEIISTRLYGYLRIPAAQRLTQNRKSPSPISEIASVESIAHQVLEDMEEDVYYLIGAGTTTRGIMYLLGLPNTLIGVDLVYNRQLIASNIYGHAILNYIRGKRVKLVVTVTGGQGFLFGRGNQQLTTEVLREIGRENILVVATREKLAELGGEPLLVDTYDEALNRSLCGYYKIICGYGEYTMCRVAE